MTTHTLHKCERDCAGCVYCLGGLAFCDVCKGAEASLPTDCPSRRLTADEQDAIQAGTVDYVGGKWRAGKT